MNEVATGRHGAQHDGHGQPPCLAHHFDDIGQQREAESLGMWGTRPASPDLAVFLVGETGLTAPPRQTHFKPLETQGVVPSTLCFSLPAYV
jgi:hypothetical protein